MKILICLLALLCNFASLKLHANVKRCVCFGLPAYMRSNFSLRLFLFLEEFYKLKHCSTVVYMVSKA